MKEVILLYGNTCTGKSTIGRKLEGDIGARYLSFGDLKRQEIAKKSEIGFTLESAIHTGKPIDPLVGAQLISFHIDNGFNVVSGFPISHAELDAFLDLCECRILLIVVIKVKNEIIRRRFAKRGICPICQLPGEVGESCFLHKVPLESRIDASQEELLARFRLYEERIKPFIEELEDYPKLTIEASRLSPEEVVLEIKANLWPANIRKGG